MRIPLLAGRDFTERDNGSAPRVVIINESMARFYFGDENPVGARIRWNENDPSATEIVGVVRDFARGWPRATGKPWFLTYFPYRDPEALNIGAQSRLRGMMVALRTAGEPRALASRVRQELRAIDPNLPVLRIKTVEEQLRDVLAQDSLMAALSSLFSALALTLACIGLYGVMSYAVARRTSELGIRLALGATPAGVRGMVLRESMVLVAAGIALGLGATAAVTRVISSLLFGVSPTDLLTIGPAVLLMFAMALAAAYVPAHRASKVDPMVALRYG